MLFFNISYIHAQNINLTVSNATQTKMPFALIVPKKSCSITLELATTIKKDLLFTNQFDIKIHSIQNNASKKELANTIKMISAKQIPLALNLHVESDNIVTWRLYDTMQGIQLNGKKYKPQGTVARGWAHTIADDIIKTLTGNDSFFSSRIVYCKESKTDDNKKIKHMYIADFDGSNAEIMVDTPTITVAPRWNTDTYNPAIFYSEYTDTNVQLMSIDMHKNKKISSNLDGITMSPSFSPDKTSVVYCASHGKGHCQLYYQTKNSPLRPLTKKGNNVSPFFIDNENICFCSDYQTKSPQLYIGNIKTGHIHRITKGGYCTSPSYCTKNNAIAYHARINNIMQICVYDCASKKHTQITYGPENKHEVSWSPDGTYLLFAKEATGKSRITALNIATKKLHYLTSEQDDCSYPHWSPNYTIFPTILTKPIDSLS
jgi:TolB protein